MMDDLISRAAAIDAVLSEERYCERNMDSEATAVVQMARFKLEKVPVVNAVPVVHAKWVEETDHSYHWHCSKCKQVWGIKKYFMKYCPNCGAKMDGET